MQIVELYYGICLILSVILSCLYAFLWDRRFNVNMTLLFAMVPVVNLGHVFLAAAKNLEAAIRATQIIYLGGSFLILFITFFIFDMCRVRLPKAVSTIMISTSMAVYLCVLTIGRGKIFYRDVSGALEDGMYVMHKVYGPVHTVFYVLLILYFAAAFAVIFYSFFCKKQISRRIIRLLFFPEVVSMVSFLGVRIFSLSVEMVPAAFVFAQIMYLVIANYTCLYSIEDMAADSLMETGDVGFISVDAHLNYLGSNEIARKIFPELNFLTVDMTMKRSRELWDLFTPKIFLFRENEKKDKFYTEKMDRIYLVDINYLFHNGRKRGYQLVISDDTKNQKYIKLLDQYNTELGREVEAKTADILKLHNHLIRSMAKLVESRDNSTGGHIIRTSDVVGILLEEIWKDQEFTEQNGITDDLRKDLIKAAPLHDIGKIAVDDEILRKPGRFTREEFEQMKLHAPEGAKVLHSILKDTNDESFRIVAENVAHYHHERMDGSGYPDGLKGDDIPIEARIMAIADVYDALVSKRVYKDRMSYEKADSIMMESMGKHFDKRLEKYYIAARSRIEDYYREKELEEEQA